jgi:hypothetical protein
MDFGLSIAQPSSLDPGSLNHVDALLLNVEFDKTSKPQILVLDGVEFWLMRAVDVADFAKPTVHEAKVLRLHCCCDPPAAVMTANDDVFDVQDLDRVLQRRLDVHVDVADQVGDVSMDKNVAWLQSHDFVGWDSAVRTPDIKEVGSLGRGEALKIVVTFCDLFGNPAFVVFEDFLVDVVCHEFLGLEARHYGDARIKGSCVEEFEKIAADDHFVFAF